MKRTITLAAVAACALIAASCARQSNNPSAPSVATPAGLVGLNADGSALKVNAPAQVSPLNGFRFQQQTPVVLVVTNASSPYASGLPLTYQFDVLTPA